MRIETRNGLIGLFFVLPVVALAGFLINRVIAQPDVKQPKSVALALANQKRGDVIYKKSKEFGLSCPSYTEPCAALISRAESNPRLREALRKASSFGVYLTPTLDTGLTPIEKVQQGNILVPVVDSDEEIIEFLTK